MKLTVTITGDFTLDEADLKEMQEDLEDECRAYWGGHGVVVEVVRG